MHFVDRNGEILGRCNHPKIRITGWITDKLLMGNFISNPTNFFRRGCYECCGEYKENLFPPGDWTCGFVFPDIIKSVTSAFHCPSIQSFQIPVLTVWSAHGAKNKGCG